MGKGAADKVDFNKKAVSRRQQTDPYRRTLRRITEIRLEELFIPLCGHPAFDINIQQAADFIRVQHARPELIAKQLPVRLREIIPRAHERVTDAVLDPHYKKAINILAQVSNESRTWTDATAREVSRVRKVVDQIEVGAHTLGYGYRIYEDLNNDLHLVWNENNNSEWSRNPDVSLIYEHIEDFFVVDAEKFRDSLALAVVTRKEEPLFKNTVSGAYEIVHPEDDFFYDKSVDKQEKEDWIEGFDTDGVYEIIEWDDDQYFLVDVDRPVLIPVEEGRAMCEDYFSPRFVDPEDYDRLY